uniref:Uncharacterized protein n=1 Tax=Ditylenchus dipsaci TaxID=166011 RepID=A0A915DG44_9BILA
MLKSFQEQKLPDPLPFNILVCAGGVNDRMREKYIEDPLNSSIFKIANYVVDEPAKRYVVKGKPAIVLAVGDALANNHFFNGAGFSTARKAVERAVATVSNAQSYAEILEKKLNKELKLCKYCGRNVVRIFKTSSCERPKVLAVKRMCDLVNNLISQNTNDQTKFEFSTLLSYTMPNNSSCFIL